MNVYHHYPRDSRGIGRTAGMMERYAPLRIQFVGREEEADLVLVHVCGRRDHVLCIVERARAAGRRYAIVQHSLRSTRNKNANEWRDVWRGADVVWSAYDLPKLCAEDNARAPSPFYYAPYGADAEVFSAPLGNGRRYVLGTNGTAMSHESMQECFDAARATGRLQFHLGCALQPIPGVVDVRDNIGDAEVAAAWGQCAYVAGLRLIEGFELPAAEGLLCGARPILFDRPHYQWFAPWAAFIPEIRDSAKRTQAIEAVLCSSLAPVTAQERADAAVRFDWRTIVGGFWEHIDA